MGQLKAGSTLHSLKPILSQAQLALESQGDYRREGGPERQVLPHMLQPCLLSVYPTSHLSNASHDASRERRWQFLLPLIQQLLDTPAAEEDVGNFLQGPLQALPPCAHFNDRHPESSISQDSSEGEG